jgi:hypothetical protein
MNTEPRCQHVSPSPWGAAQCVLPDGHDEHHAYSPSEATILGVDLCEHGKARAWHVEARPSDPAPPIERCPACDRDTVPLRGVSDEH